MYQRLRTFLGSTLGCKYLMAITGLLLFGFVVAHLLGNLLVFAGQKALNDYAEGLHKLPLNLLWVMRIGLLGVFLVHLRTAWCLRRKNKGARPIGYQMEQTIQASFTSRYMYLTGLLLFAFIVYHLCHFTFTILPGTTTVLDDLGRPDVYKMVVDGFSHPAIALSYIVSMVILGLHLSHGLASMFQSLGCSHGGYRNAIRTFGLAAAWGIAGANILLVCSIWFGFIGVK